MLSAPWPLCLVHARLITQPGGSRVRALCMTWPGSGTRSARSSRPMVVLALDLQPRPAATRTVGRIPSLRHDPFQPKDTRALQDQRAVAVQRLAQSQARMRLSSQLVIAADAPISLALARHHCSSSVGSAAPTLSFITGRLGKDRILPPLKKGAAHEGGPRLGRKRPKRAATAKQA